MKKMKNKFLFLLTVMCVMIFTAQGQPIPSESSNIDFLMTFGNDADAACGDDDFSQVIFVGIPRSRKAAFYIRVYDPGTGGRLDEVNDHFNTKTRYTVYGGFGTFTDPDAKSRDPKGFFNSGIQLATKTFGQGKRYDLNWYTFGPFNPSEGEYVDAYGVKIFKIIAEGIFGDDGNAYKYFISERSDKNIPVQQSWAFAYELTIRLMRQENTVVNLYPYIDDNCTGLLQANYNFGVDGQITAISEVKAHHRMAKSTNGSWAMSKHRIDDAEKNKMMHIEISTEADIANNITYYYTTTGSGQASYDMMFITGYPATLADHMPVY